MKIQLLLEEPIEREVKLIGKVICTRSDKYNMSWEFQKDVKYDIYEEVLKDGSIIYIVCNNGWYAIYNDINYLSDVYYDFVY